MVDLCWCMLSSWLLQSQQFNADHYVINSKPIKCQTTKQLALCNLLLHIALNSLIKKRRVFGFLLLPLLYTTGIHHRQFNRACISIFVWSSFVWLQSRLQRANCWIGRGKEWNNHNSRLSLAWDPMLSGRNGTKKNAWRLVRDCNSGISSWLQFFFCWRERKKPHIHASNLIARQL